MKRILKLLAFIMCAILLVSLMSCEFMPASQVKKTVEEFGIPQAEMTLTFSTSTHTYRYVIVYDLLLEKTPITTINFINLVNDGFYQDAIFESYNSSNNYFLAGRYTYRKSDDSADSKAKGAENTSGLNIKGEFKTNNYPEPNGGYEQFSIFSLAMYHENTAENVNSANGALIFSTASTSSEINAPLNYANYAVFARMNSITIYQGNDEAPIYHREGNIIASDYLSLIKQTSTTSCEMTLANGNTKTVTVLGKSGIPYFKFSIKMLGDKDWSKLPKVN